ncbi:hypothetical protein FB561_4059 [Kribbella amoyensis]|uniref:DUF1579 domain-containing protein n=1 Tax=Kribbella amoyensis TaxID=996641 RepID=A0A561BVQ3_9ACTN|nr:hypothetical protein [Kribbella amoyensis]TWD82913.1 hypothetical protein FB561_4059 [Kribbella amoyensis]
MNHTENQQTIADECADQGMSYGATEPPTDAVRALDRLVGTWTVSGGAEGTVRYEWMQGGYFLYQHVELTQYGTKVSGLEIIGHLHPFGEPVGTDVASRFYDSQGNTFDYVYDLTGETLTIWAGAKGSPAYYEGTFSPDGTTVEGAWTYPGGGGYSSTMTRA